MHILFSISQTQYYVSLAIFDRSIFLPCYIVKKNLQASNKEGKNPIKICFIQVFKNKTYIC